MSVGIMLYSLSGSTSSKSDKSGVSRNPSLSAKVIALLHLLSVLLYAKCCVDTSCPSPTLIQTAGDIASFLGYPINSGLMTLR